MRIYTKIIMVLLFSTVVQTSFANCTYKKSPLSEVPITIVGDKSDNNILDYKFTIADKALVDDIKIRQEIKERESELIQLLDEGTVIEQYEGQMDALYVPLAYYAGVYVPKDDCKALYYLQRLAKIYDYHPTENSDLFFYGFGTKYYSYVNPLNLPDTKTEDEVLGSVYKLLIESGHVATIIVLLVEYNKEISQDILETIKDLAEQGNISAKRGFLDIYEKSSPLLQKKYAEAHQKIKEEVEKLPPKDIIRWN